MLCECERVGSICEGKLPKVFPFMLGAAFRFKFFAFCSIRADADLHIYLSLCFIACCLTCTVDIVLSVRRGGVFCGRVGWDEIKLFYVRPFEGSMSPL